MCRTSKVHATNMPYSKRIDKTSARIEVSFYGKNKCDSKGTVSSNLIVLRCVACDAVKNHEFWDHKLRCMATGLHPALSPICELGT